MLKPVSAHSLGSEEGTACAGLAGAVLLPVTGLGVGLTQAVRGAINTPEAIRESSRGRQWDQVLPLHPLICSYQHHCRPNTRLWSVVAMI